MVIIGSIFGLHTYYFWTDYLLMRKTKILFTLLKVFLISLILYLFISIKLAIGLAVRVNIFFIQACPFLTVNLISSLVC